MFGRVYTLTEEELRDLLRKALQVSSLLSREGNHNEQVVTEVIYEADSDFDVKVRKERNAKR